MTNNKYCLGLNLQSAELLLVSAEIFGEKHDHF